MPDQAALDALGADLKALAARRGTYARFDDYYHGRHRLTYATDRFANQFASVVRGIKENLCGGVVDAVADRLLVQGFGVEQGLAELGGLAWGIWLANRMDRRAGEVHLEALRAGDAYAVVWPGPDDAPTIWPQGAAAVAVTYAEDRPGAIVRATKAWRVEDGRTRVTLYYPDRIEKYVTRARTPGGIPDTARGLVEYESEGEPWPLPNPYGRVPVFHFANNAGVGEPGTSELADVVAAQDALNKTLADRAVGQEFMALPQRWATGLEVDVDPETGKPRPTFAPGADRVWAVGAPDVHFGQFDAADLDKLTNVANDWRLAIARISRTPLHYLLPNSGDYPSGEAIKVAEAPFVAKVRDRQAAAGNFWEDVMAFALRIADAAQDARLSTLWNDPSPRAEKDQAETLEIKARLGVSEPQILREFGYSSEQIVGMLRERAAALAVADGETTEDER